jgi:hypothetical protein
MAEETCVGVAISDFEVHFAVSSPDKMDARDKVVRLQDTAAPSVRIRPVAGADFPVALCNVRSFDSLDWMTHTMRLIRAGSPQVTQAADYRICIAISSSAGRRARDLCREIIRQHGWPGGQVCGHNLAIAVDRFQGIATPVTALICEIEFEHVHLSLVSALKGVARIRDQWIVPSLSHRMLDEAILAGLQRSLGLNKEERADWSARWSDAYSIRKQLENTVVAALALNPKVWGRRATVDACRDDLLPLLERGVETLLDATKRLLAKNQVQRDELEQILLVGGSPLSWNVVRERFGTEFAVGTQIVPHHYSATGAARLARNADEASMDVADATLLPDSSISLDARQPFLDRSTKTAQFHVEIAPDQAPASRETEHAEFARSLDAIWTYIRGVSSVSPERSLELVRMVLRQGDELLAQLDEPKPSRALASNPHLENARDALTEANFEKAVAQAHKARELDPDDPSVFRDMIDIHIQAAKGSASDEQAVRWLECAHAHDQSDTTVHRLLAEYAFRWAQHLEQEGRVPEAIKMVDRSLMFQPFSDDATKLSERLRKR